MHAPIPVVFSFFFLPFSFFHSVPFFYFQFLTLLLWVVPHLVFSFLGSLSLGAYYSLTMGFSLQVPLPPWVPFFRCFSSPFQSPFSAVVTFLLQQTDSMGFLPFTPRASPNVVCCGHPFKITHSPIGCPCHCSIHVYCTTTHFTTKFPFFYFYCMPLPHYLALWHALDGPNHLLLLLGKIPSQQDIFPKEIIAGNQI